MNAVEKRKEAIAWWQYLSAKKKIEFAKDRDPSTLTGREIQNIFNEQSATICDDCNGSGVHYKYDNEIDCAWCEGTGRKL